jgi:hypothetical protein
MSNVVLAQPFDLQQFHPPQFFQLLLQLHLMSRIASVSAGVT